MKVTIIDKEGSRESHIHPNFSLSAIECEKALPDWIDKLCWMIYSIYGFEEEARMEIVFTGETQTINTDSTCPASCVIKIDECLRIDNQFFFLHLACCLMDEKEIILLASWLQVMFVVKK